MQHSQACAQHVAEALVSTLLKYIPQSTSSLWPDLAPITYCWQALVAFVGECSEAAMLEQVDPCPMLRVKHEGLQPLAEH